MSILSWQSNQRLKSKRIARSAKSIQELLRLLALTAISIIVTILATAPISHELTFGELDDESTPLQVSEIRIYGYDKNDVSDYHFDKSPISTIHKGMEFVVNGLVKNQNHTGEHFDYITEIIDNEGYVRYLHVKYGVAVPLGGQIGIDSETPSHIVLDKAGNYTLKVFTWRNTDGIPMALSGGATKSITIVEKPNAVTCQELSLCTYQLKVGNVTYPINFRMNGTIENMVAEPQSATLTVTIQLPENPISLQIAIPREVVDSKTNPEYSNSPDDSFAVFVDEEPVEVDEIPIQAREWTIALGISDNPEKYRILIIPIDYDSVKVEIVGTWLT